MIEPFIPTFLAQEGVHKLHPLLVSETDGARLLGISRGQFKALVADGEIAVVNVAGRERRVVVASIVNYVGRLTAARPGGPVPSR